MRAGCGVPLVWRRGLFGVAAWVVLALSLSPVEHLPSQVFDIWDKAQHAMGFAGLMVLGGWAWPAALGRVALGLLVYGVCIEVAQQATGWRHGDVLDALANAVGVCTGAVLGALMRKFVRPRTP